MNDEEIKLCKDCQSGMCSNCFREFCKLHDSEVKKAREEERERILYLINEKIWELGQLKIDNDASSTHGALREHAISNQIKVLEIFIEKLKKESLTAVRDTPQSGEGKNE